MTSRVAYRVSALLFLSGLAHLVVFFVNGGPWEGPVSWRKAVTFGLSFGLTLASYTWVAGFVRLRSVWVGVFTGASVAEVALISLQAWRKVPSHFNESTAFDTLVTRALTVGGITLVVCVVALAVAVFKASLPPAMRLAARVGAASLVVAMAFGGLMVAERGGSWKLAHGVAMHGVLLLPLLAWLLDFTTWEDRRKVRVVRAAAGGYAALVGAAAVFNALV
ncbi:hypothetical protein [Saccharothrix variisporea]|uniref:Uncharacterized protein n=1 Tax=Saccharothrix variisporea TaxID=543527 RepID=A0A495XF15_9PSEU|nr:hypothetical protein [Saccharothrix variisporea]RKT72860.1 hypothetical protein DFJ66_6184 [Saccharothrix variisporea]